MAIRVINEYYMNGNMMIPYSSILTMFQFGVEGLLNDMYNTYCALKHKDKYGHLKKRDLIKKSRREFAQEDKANFERMLDELERAGILEKEQRSEMLYRMSEKGKQILDPVWKKYVTDLDAGTDRIV